MKKIITALANPMLNNELKKQKDFIIIGNDIQYQDGVKEVLEKEKNIDFLILSEILPGENKIEKLIEDIKEMNPNINIIIILENKKEELEKYLYSKSIYYILYNKTEITEIINLIKNKKEDEREKIKKELNENEKNSKLEKLINKKIKSNTTKSSYALKQKIIYDMKNLGYDISMINEILDNSNISSNNNVISKEYSKLYHKLSNKYEGEELSRQIYYKLRSKGFNDEEITNIKI